MDSYIWGLILVGAAATFATRALPFVLLAPYKDHPLLQFLGRYLPPVMMVLLLVYASASLALTPSASVTLLSAMLILAILQWYLRNPLLSIFVGTLVYAVLQRLI